MTWQISENIETKVYRNFGGAKICMNTHAKRRKENMVCSIAFIVNFIATFNR